MRGYEGFTVQSLRFALWMEGVDDASINAALVLWQETDLTIDEILHLHKEDIDRENRVIHVRDRTNGVGGPS